MNNMMTDGMYKDAVMNLLNGVVYPGDKDILSYAPLPDSVINPYVRQEIDPLQTMNLTNNTLKVWVEESEKASYFTEHFVTLSRLIMNGVATMARGLVTLHMRGEDLEQAPLSIQDLICISSYQFRKSHLGVLQTVKSHRIISDHLMMNMLRWNNTLIKLFKTREKLARPEVSCECSVSGERCLKADEESDAGSIPPAASFGYQIQEPGGGIAELPALTESGAYGAIRAYGAFQNKKSEIKNQKPDDAGLLTEGEPEFLNDGMPEDGGAVSDVLMTGHYLETEIQPDEAASGEARESKSELPESREVPDVQMEEADQTEQDEEPEDALCSFEDDPGYDMDFGTEGSDRPPLPDPDHPPEFFRILYQAACRNTGPEQGMDFTIEEVHQLLADPEFRFYEPKMAVKLIELLKTIEI